MAYLRSIDTPKCSCGAKATKTLLNSRNATMGDYCAKCAARRLRELKASEARSFGTSEASVARSG